MPRTIRSLKQKTKEERNNMKSSIYISGVSVLLSVLINVGIPRANAQEGKSGSDPMTESLQQLTGKEFEAGFLNQMIQHHRGAIDMAKMVSSHTKRPELNEFADKIVSAQTKEISELTEWLKEWQGAEPKMMPNKMADKKMKAEMPKLEAAKDAEFDKMFLEMMIEHHAGAVRMSSLVKEKNTRPELLKFAENVIKDQTAEIQRMEDWKKTWFKK
jgi:uncharacterized protein (DUF305 family)